MPWDPRSPRSAEYGTDHAKARASAALVHDPADPCTRCGHELGPMGPWLHYDHRDDRSGYAGFAHGAPCPTCGVRCNVVAGARKGRAAQEVTRVSW